ncbi:DNA repair protein RadC [Anoxybacillus ayderensis]|nr:DNA repair protein RadC [Anoxybacillus ayderensis]
MQPAKRVNIVSVKLVREGSVLYRERRVQSPEDAYQLLKPFLVDADREVFVVVCLDTKNQPTAIHVCHVGSLNASIVHPREVFKLKARCLSRPEGCRRLVETESR